MGWMHHLGSSGHNDSTIPNKLFIHNSPLGHSSLSLVRFHILHGYKEISSFNFFSLFNTFLFMFFS